LVKNSQERANVIKVWPLSGVHIDTEMRHTKFHFFWQTLLNCGLSKPREKSDKFCVPSYRLCSNFKYPTRLLHAFSTPLLCMICKPSLNSKTRRVVSWKKDRKRKSFKKDAITYPLWLFLLFYIFVDPFFPTLQERRYNTPLF